jgi:adenine-specific DNA-methyltransferase
MTSKELQNKLSARFDFDEWKGILTEMFPKVEFFTSVNQVSHELIKDGGQAGLIRLDDDCSLAVYTFEVNDNVLINRNRKGLREIAANPIDQSIIHGALAFYYSKNVSDYRLTFIAKQTSFNEDGELIKTETAPKRYTFLLGENEPCRTAAERLFELISKKKTSSIKLADVIDAFSVERLNKEFFAGYKAQYSKFLKQLSDTKPNRDYVKKLLGRLVFLQFLQKKGWMGVPASRTDWKGGDKNYLSHLIERYEGNDRLLSDVLEVLFFNTLNDKREGDIADSRLGENIKIPYLNGGLFEKDNIDRLDIDFPYSYFKELMDFFAMYNFTIDENDPDDSEVGIDPEMLGHIFENLLEDNKDKGAFYTPKEIVQYMCRQSVIQYLKKHTNSDFYPAIESLILYRKVNEIFQEKENALKIYTLLKSIKVCDPAIGSGAFPMGVLNVLFHARQLLYGFTQDKHTFSHAEVKREIIQENIFGVDIEQGAVDIARLRFWLALVVDEETPQPLPNLDYKIVCGDSLLNRTSLDSPIMNVFTEYNRNKKDEDKITLNKYQALIHDYLNTSNHTVKDRYKTLISEIKSYFKTELEDKMRFYTRDEKKLIEKYFMYLNLSSNMKTLFDDKKDENNLSPKAQKDLNKIRKVIESKNQYANTVKYDKLYKNAFEWRYEFPSLLDDNGDFKGFDLVIGNPPYLRIQGIREVNPDFADELVERYKSATGSFDLYVTFVERGLQIVNSSGIVNYIMPIKWTNSAFGKGLRELVSNKTSQIINFGAYQVFNASTYTALQWFTPNSKELAYYELDRNLTTNEELGAYLNSLNDESKAIIKSDKLDKETWVLTVGDSVSILNNLDLHKRRISDIFDRIFCGLQTSKDDVYFLYECNEKDGMVYGYSKYLERNICIERGLVKPLLKGEDVHRYEHLSTDRFVVFPYKIENGKANLYSEKELSELFPDGYAYLKECEEVLRGREKGRLKNDDYWFRYIYPKNLVLFDNEKLVAPDISMGGNFTYDSKGVFYQTTTVYGYLKKPEIKEGYKFWMALFNSRLFWWYLKNTGTVLANGFFRFKPDYVKPFPVPEIIPPYTEHLISTLCDYILFIKGQNTNLSDLVSNKLISDFFEKIIDGCIYEIYFGDHMKELNINIIDSAIGLIKPIEGLLSNEEKGQVILDTFMKIKKTDNEIRNRLDLLTIKSPKVLKVIIED